MEPRDDLTPALDEARRRRATLHDQLVHLEHSISSPAAGREAEWSNTVTKEMVGLRDAFEQHVLATEKPGGLYEEIIERSPRLEGKVKRLHDEHPEIAERITAVLKRLEDAEAGTDMWPIPNCRDDLQRLLGGIVRHRQHGADLVWEAYNVDIGGPE
jgi:predicted  nucleic acid-binding Zn-ribbon protein